VEDINKLERDIRCAKPALKRWKNTLVLIIDEGIVSSYQSGAFTHDPAVSMVDGHLFDRIVKLAIRLRKASDRPCGGIQVRKPLLCY
jgi:hypothetical protein